MTETHQHFVGECAFFQTERRVYIEKSSLQCYIVLSDILVKNELCIPLERGANFLSTGEGFICLSPPSKLKDKDYSPIEIIKGLTDKGQFQYLSKLMGPQEGTYLYATQFHSQR